MKSRLKPFIAPIVLRLPEILKNQSLGKCEMMAMTALSVRLIAPSKDISNMFGHALASRMTGFSITTVHTSRVAKKPTTSKQKQKHTTVTAGPNLDLLTPGSLIIFPEKKAVRFRTEEEWEDRHYRDFKLGPRTVDISFGFEIGKCMQILQFEKGK